LPAFVVRRDPRDLSRVFVLDPQDGAYVEVPCARQERPGISLHEHRRALDRLKAAGLARVDEEAIFRAVAEQREIARAAAAHTRSARRRLARARAGLAESVPRAASPLAPTAPTSADGAGGDDELVVVPDLYSVTRW
jgi:putative transposase